MPCTETSLCADLDAELTAFRTRPLDHIRFPYIYLDATYCKARVNHQIVSQAVVTATGITEDGGREVLGDGRRQRDRGVQAGGAGQRGVVPSTGTTAFTDRP